MTAEQAFRRLATAVTKYWVCKRGPNHAYEVMECLGSNGYIEDFPLAMRYREQPVMAFWEGSGNVVALDVLRATSTEPESVAASFAELRLAAGAQPVFDGFDGFDDFAAKLREQVAVVARNPQDHAGQARNLVEKMALAF